MGNHRLQSQPFGSNAMVRKPPFIVESIGTPEFPPDSVEIFQVLDNMADAVCDCVNEDDANMIANALNIMNSNDTPITDTELMESLTEMVVGYTVGGKLTDKEILQLDTILIHWACMLLKDQIDHLEVVK